MDVYVDEVGKRELVRNNLLCGLPEPAASRCDLSSALIGAIFKL